MTGISTLKKRADGNGYAIRSRDGRFALVDVESGGTTHPHDALNSPYALTLDDLEAEIDRLTE